MKKLVASQYKAIVDLAQKKTVDLDIPPEGWLRTVRKALGMSGAQLARRLKVTRGHVSKTEHEELEGRVLVRTMDKMAKAMGCRFVYAIVPPETIDALIIKQAKRKAKSIVAKANIQMALEEQLLSDEKIQFEIDNLVKSILDKMPSDLWDDE